MNGAARKPARPFPQVVTVGLVAWAVARTAGADRWPRWEGRTVPLLSFTPWAALAAPPAAALLRMSGRKREAAAVALAGSALAGAVLPRGLARRQPTVTGPVLRVLTANLLGGRACAEAVVTLARTTGADVLMLQEITDHAATRLKQAGLDELLPHTVAEFRAGHSRSSAIYARAPLSDAPSLPDTHAAAPAARLDLPGGYAVDLLCVHPRAPVPPTATGVARWRRELDMLPPTDGPPRVIAGDFNATLDHWQFRQVLRRGYTDAAAETGQGLIPTWGLLTGPPLIAIDHVLADRRCAVLTASVHRLPGSDHRAVFAEIRLPG